jgi:tRNA-2-methylthio-N6-dimethylallyladenosine synthase
MVEKRVYLETYGCQMNVGDSERLLGFLSEANYAETDDPSKADLILINTCSVRDKAEHKVYSAAGRYRELKALKPALKIAIAGCVAQQKGEGLLKRLPFLDVVLGTQSVHRIVDALEQASNNGRVAMTGESDAIDPDEFASIRARKGDVKAFVSIMRGCDNFCAYCIVPHTRGREASRPPGEIVSEVERLAATGVREVTLLGQNVNSYGLKRAGRTEGSVGVGFPELLRMVAVVEGIERVRFVTSHPKDISDELMGLFAEEPKLCRHVHLPMQSGSTAVLEAMGRGYTLKDYADKFRKLKALYPDMAVTTDVIVGFPGETDEDFELTMEAINELRFDNVFSFKYSKRPGTRAAGFQGQVSDEVKAERLTTLQAAQRDITFELNKERVGSRMKTLVEGRSRNDSRVYMGRTSCNRIVNFTSYDDASGPTMGEIVDVDVTDAYPNSLRGVWSKDLRLC